MQPSTLGVWGQYCRPLTSSSSLFEMIMLHLFIDHVIQSPETPAPAVESSASSVQWALHDGCTTLIDILLSIYRSCYSESRDTCSCRWLKFILCTMSTTWWLYNIDWYIIDFLFIDHVIQSPDTPAPAVESSSSSVQWALHDGCTSLIDILLSIDRSCYSESRHTCSCPWIKFILCWNNLHSLG